MNVRLVAGRAAGGSTVARSAAGVLAAVLMLAGAGQGPGWCAAGAESPSAGEEGFQAIFDGHSLDGWDGDPKFWRVEDGAIVGQTTAENPARGNTFLIWRGGQPADFELKLEYKLTNHNSGVQYRSWEEPENWGKWVIGGYQADIDQSGRYSGICYGERFRGILAERGQQTVIGEDHKPRVVGSVGNPDELLQAIDLGGWNEYHIIARGNHIVQKINGRVMCELTDEDRQMRRASGLIALQLHAGPPMTVRFRNIRLKQLPQADPQMQGPPAKKKIVFIAGPKSHGYAGHEHYAGCVLLARCLADSGLPVETVVYRDGWPQPAGALDGAATVVIFADGGGGHPAMGHLDELGKLMAQGVGLVCLHYAVEIPKGEPGDKLKSWIGGYFETFWSVNPFWRAEFKEFPQHPVAAGLKPFAIDDEWYYHMRFVDDMKGVTPILTAVPPDSTRERPDGAHSGNPTVRARKGMPEHVGWIYERPGGGRGMGFTGGHWHWNWACDSFRTFVLNSIVWTAGLDVPAGGVPSKRPTIEELKANQDYPEPAGFDWQRIERLIEELNQ